METNRTRPKLPVQQFIILAICRVSEPIAFTSVFPYLPEMVHSIGAAKKDVAKWVGLISAAFSISQCLTAVTWGSLSDRVGRKPIILLGFFLTMVFSLMFGFSTTLEMAIISRICIGLGNGNVGIIRTMIAELTPDKELQPRAFSVMPLVWTIGSIFGPVIGGALANPAKRHPALFGDNWFFKKYPFALPNIAVSIFFIIGIIIGILFLRETLESKKNSRDYGLVLGQILTGPCTRKREKPVKAPQPEGADERSPLLGGDSRRPDPETNKNDKPAESEKLTLSWRQMLTPQVILILLGYTLLGLQSLSFDAMFPVFLNYPAFPTEDNPEATLPFKFAQGLGMDSQAIGILYTFNGIVGILIQFLVYPYTARRFGVLRCLLVASWSLPIIYLLIPFTALLPTEGTRRFAAFLLMTSKLAGVVYAFPCLVILLTNSAPDLRVLGTLNGIATSVAGVGRAAGPAAIGSVFSFGVKQGYIIIPWTVLAFVCVVSAAPLLWIVEPQGFAHDSEAEEEEEQCQSGCSEEDSRCERDVSWEEEDGSSTTRAPTPTSQPMVQNGRSTRKTQKTDNNGSEPVPSRAYDADDSDTASISEAASDTSSRL